MIITTSSSTKRQQQQEQQQQPTSSDQTTMETSPPPSLSSSSTSRYYFTPSSQQPSSMINTIVADLPSQQQTEIRENGNLDANTSRMILYGGMEEEDGCCCYDKEQYHEEDGGSHYYYGRVVVHRYYYRFMRRSGAAARYVNDCCRSYFRRLMRPSSSSSSSSQNNNNNNNILPNIISRFLLIGLCYALFYILLLLNDSSSPSSSSPQQQQQQQTLSTALLHPGGIIFNTFLLWISSLVLGYVVEIIFCGMQLRIVGMILAGLLLTNGLPPHVRDLVCLDNETSLTAGVIRGMGLTVILIRSGLEIDVNKLFRRSSSSNRSGGGSGGGGGGGSTMGRMTLRLTILPGLIEATCVALVVHHASSLSSSSSFVPGFEMPYLWGYSLGFILAAVSPAIVVGGMLRLQKDGYGVEKGIPSMVVMAASFDDVVAISGFSVVMDLAIRSASSSSGGGGGGGAFLTLESLIHGPLSVLLGVGVGCAGGFVLSATCVWNTRGKRSLAMMFLGLIIMFGTKEMHFSGSGALGVIVMAMTASSCWRRGGCVVFDDYVSCFTTTRRRRRRRQRRQRQLQQQHDHHNDEFNDEIEQQYSNNNSSNNNNKKKNSNNNLTSMVHDTERDFENIWNIACEPLLFGVIGNALDFTTISNETISKSLMVVTIGLCFRLVTAYLATAGGSSSSSSSSGGGGVVTNDNERTGGAEERADETTTTTTTTTKTAFFTHSERLFIALSWIPKATVQAALCSLPLDLIKEHLSDSENYELYLEWGHIILSTSIVSILVTAPLGVLFIQFLGPRLLTRDTKNDDDDDDDDTAAVGVAVAAADDGDEETAEESGQYDWSRREEEGDTSMELDTTMESVDSKMCDDV